LASNLNPKAVFLLKQTPSKIYWPLLSEKLCDEAIEILKENQENIHWKSLCRNSSIGALKLLKEKSKKFIGAGCQQINATKQLRCLKNNISIRLIGIIFQKIHAMRQ